MKQLPTWYKFVGALCIAYGLMYVLINISMANFPTRKMEWLLILTPFGTLLGGALLFSKVRQLWIASVILILVGCLLILQTALLTLEIAKGLEQDPSGLLGVVICGPVLVLPALMGPTTVLTGILLFLRLARSE